MPSTSIYSSAMLCQQLHSTIASFDLISSHCWCDLIWIDSVRFDVIEARLYNLSRLLSIWPSCHLSGRWYPPLVPPKGRNEGTPPTTSSTFKSEFSAISITFVRNRQPNCQLLRLTFSVSSGKTALIVSFFSCLHIHRGYFHHDNDYGLISLSI